MSIFHRYATDDVTVVRKDTNESKVFLYRCNRRGLNFALLISKWNFWSAKVT